MAYNPAVHHRRTIRLQGFDYSQAGVYFVTIVTHERECLFGNLDNGQMESNLAGQCAAAVLQTIPDHFPIILDEWVVMPNHVHILFTIIGTSESNSPVDSIPLVRLSTFGGIQARSLGAFIQNYKSISTRRIHAIQYYSQKTIWQRNYYEHIVRDQDDYERIKEYIQNNPLNWEEDELMK